MSDTASGPPSTGGIDLGPMGQVHGQMPGLRGVTTVAADLGPALAFGWLKRKAAKEHNDQPGATTVGTQEGNVVKEPPVNWTPDF